MSNVVSFLLIATGVAQLVFGFYFFYALLPLWYALLGAHLGAGISEFLFGQDAWENHLLSWILIVSLSALFGIGSSKLNEYRQYLLGGLIGGMIGLLIATTFEIGGLLTIPLILGVAVLFAFLSEIMFDLLLIIGSSFIGAAFLIDGMYLVSRSSALSRSDDAFLAELLWALLTMLGIVIQYGAVRKITPSQDTTSETPA